MSELDALDRKLLNRMQTDFPLICRPYLALADGLGLAEKDVLDRLARLRQTKVLRQISAIFDSQALGYSSALIAAERASDHLQEAADVVSAHPGVSHNYQRDHAFDLWFTLAVPPERGLMEEADWLALRAGFRRFMVLPAVRTFGVGVAFDLESGLARSLSTGANPAQEPGPGVALKVPLKPMDRAVVRHLQEDLPMVEQPFLQAARHLGWAEADLLAWMDRAKRVGWMRRFAAVLRHREAGFGEGGMGVWVVPPRLLESLGQALASESSVTHCYQRPTFKDWPYNLFTMVHGGDRRDCEAVLDSMAQRINGWTHRSVLFSTHEYKKERIKYFLDDDPWTSRMAEGGLRSGHA